MSQRFFVEIPITGSTARLDGDEARHLLAAMRAKVGDTVTLFDGSGAEFQARIAKLSKRDVEVEVLERLEVDREADCQLTLAVALPKGDRQRWLIEKSVEIGVARLIPLITKRGVAEAGSGAFERMRRWVIEASKQCGRNRLMEIGSPCEVPALPTAPVGGVWICAHPTGMPLTVTQRTAKTVTIAIGPEGGFTEEEIAAFDGNPFQLVTLGPRILRVETAAIALAAQWLVP